MAFLSTECWWESPVPRTSGPAVLHADTQRPRGPGRVLAQRLWELRRARGPTPRARTSGLGRACCLWERLLGPARPPQSVRIPPCPQLPARDRQRVASEAASQGPGLGPQEGAVSLCVPALRVGGTGPPRSRVLVFLLTFYFERIIDSEEVANIAQTGPG